jgi:hypothetical protein
VKKLLLGLSMVLMLNSCYKSSQSSETKGDGFEVEFLFEKEGIRVYRFFDGGHAHYFTDKGQTLSTQSNGKTSHEEMID